MSRAKVLDILATTYLSIVSGSAIGGGLYAGFSARKNIIENREFRSLPPLSRFAAESFECGLIAAVGVVAGGVFGAVAPFGAPIAAAAVLSERKQTPR